MKKTFKTFEEFIGDETVNSLRAKAEEIQQKDSDEEITAMDTQNIDGEDGEDDNDDSGASMGSDSIG